MAKTDVGDFRLKLLLDADKNSFDAGQKLVGGMTDSFNKLIGVARNAAVVVAAQKAITGAINEAGESLSKLHTAERLGVDAEKLNVWRAAAKIAGADANGLVTAMGKIADIQNNLKWDARGLDDFSKKLARLKIGYQEIKDLSADDALRYILEKAETMTGEMSTTEITAALEDIAGSGAADLFLELQRQGKTFNQFWNGAAATQYQTNEGMQNAADFATEVSALKETAGSILNSIGDNISGALVGPARTLNQWLTDHKTDISQGIEKIGAGTEKLVSKIGDWWGKNGDEVLSTLKMIGSIVTMLFGALTSKKAKKAYQAIGDSITGGLTSVWNVAKTAATGGDIFGALVQGFDDTIVNPLKRAFSKDYNPTVPAQEWDDTWWMDDGILRPDGTITRVAPDDWVFAARNVSDLAKAFIPAGMASTSAPAQYSIVQNFTVTGSNDIPQVIKQQAYRGTQEGLMAIMSQSSQRLQMMSGTR